MSIASRARQLTAALTCLAGASLPAHAVPDRGVVELTASDPAFHSRTCGLVLLSAGRAGVRAAKAAGTGAYAQPMGQLTSAFLLLHDGAEADRAGTRAYFAQKLSTGQTTQPANQALPGAVTHCQDWFATRRAQPDFDSSEATMWTAAQQADMTLRTE